MDKVKKIAKELKVLPRFRLMGAEGAGPHILTFLEEPMVVHGRDDKGGYRKEFRFKVEEDRKQFYWHVPIIGENGQPHYLIPKLMEIAVGEERIVELKRRGPQVYYVEIRRREEISNPEEGYIPED